MKQIGRRYKRGELSFLQYQAATYAGIEQLLKKYDLKGRAKTVAQEDLATHWMYNDGVVDSMSRSVKGHYGHFGASLTKLVLIGRYLAKEFPNP